MLRHIKIIGPAAVTSTTDNPVVVQPLTDSKIALENGIPRTEIKGQAEKTMTVSQLTRTIIPPSCTDKVVFDADLNTRHKIPPRRARHPAGRQNDRTFADSSGFGIRIKSGVSIIPLDKRRITPVEERMAA
jgi:hypothetical protein